MEVPPLLPELPYPTAPPNSYDVVWAVIDSRAPEAEQEEIRRKALQDTRDVAARFDQEWMEYHTLVGRTATNRFRTLLRKVLTKCPRCGERVGTAYSGKPEERPSSSKVSRKRTHG